MFSQPAGEVKVEGGNMFQPGPSPAFPAHQPSIKLGYSGFDNQYSATSSETGPDTGAKYQIKTMCLAKKTVRMPTKKEHGFLLFCGLGARKWQCPMDCNSLTFKQAILNIYPRLRSVIGYNLWTLTSDKKTFERIPEKINTPMRMRAYLGASFTGCLVIVPVSDIVLMEERREHLRQMDIEDSKPPGHTQLPGLFQKQEVSKVFMPQEEPAARRSLCLICGRIEKTPGTGVFHKIMEEPMPGATDRSQVIAKKLTDILGFNFEQSRKKFIASNEICRKCLRAVCDLVRKEEEVKATKEDLVTSFFSTTSKFNKNQMALGMAEDATCPEYQHPFHQKPLPLPMAFLSQAKPGYMPPTSLVQFYRPGWKADFPASQGSSSAPGSPPERKQNSAYNRLGSDTSSDVASSSFLSVSPPVGGYPPETDSTNSRASPSHLARDFDARSYASTFSLHSTGSSLNIPSQLRSKGQIKSYESYEEKEKLQESRLQGEEIASREEATSYENHQPTGDKEGSGTYSTPQSPRSQDSSNSGASDSLESTNPTRPGTPEEEKAKSEAEEAEVERRKPWKKRKRAIESDQESIQSEKVAKVEQVGGNGKGEDSTSSGSAETTPNPQGQIDPQQQ